MTMDRRDFLLSIAALALATRTELRADTPSIERQLPPDVLEADWYVESVPVPEYHWSLPLAPMKLFGT